TMDTTRADRMGFLGCKRPLTPNIDRFASKAIIFERAHSQVPITPPSHSTMLTGLYPRNHGVLVTGQRLPDRVTTLAEILKAHGYNTAAVIASVVMAPEFNINQGFDIYLYPENRFREYRAEEQTDKALEIIDRFTEAKQPMFVWVHYYDPHTDYIPPLKRYWKYFLENPYSERFDADAYRFREITSLSEEGKRVPLPEEIKLGEDLYDGEIEYMDSEIGRLLDFVEENGLLKSSIIILTADHGESFRQDCPFEHSPRVYEELIHVPLVMWIPTVKTHRRIDAQVELADITPTILDILGIEEKPEMDGVSLVNLIKGRCSKVKDFIFAETDKAIGQPYGAGHFLTLKDLNYKLVLNMTTQKVQLFPVRDGIADDRDESDLCQKKPDLCSEYTSRLFDFLEERFKNAPKPIKPELDRHLIEKIKSLGYL
ncbi:MAG TPA: hypothetical protein ENF73_04595, partial [Proteobacteria bacterium]|nr:hypothetical protein [Pseudomonadota bacterium]